MWVVARGDGLAALRALVTLTLAAAVARTVPFVAAAAVSSVPLGVDGSITGTLRGAGDTRVPFAAPLIGLYLVALPVAFLGTRLAVGASLLLLALVAETTVPALINLRRVRSGRWLEVSRAYRPSADE